MMMLFYTAKTCNMRQGGPLTSPQRLAARKLTCTCEVGHSFVKPVSISRSLACALSRCADPNLSSSHLFLCVCLGNPEERKAYITSHSRQPGRVKSTSSSHLFCLRRDRKGKHNKSQIPSGIAKAERFKHEVAGRKLRSRPTDRFKPISTTSTASYARYR